MKSKINSIGLEKDPKDTTVVVAMSGGGLQQLLEL